MPRLVVTANVIPTRAPQLAIKGLIVVACIAVALPGVDPVTTCIEGLPLAIMFELSIWLSVWLDRRAGRIAAALET